MQFTNTDEQNAVIEAAASTKDNLLIAALAGAAKTTTLVQAAARIRGATLSLAFNKAIAMEMQKKMPANVTSSTLNSLGHRTLGSALKKKLTLSSDKIGGLIRDEINAVPKTEQDALWENYRDLRQHIEWARVNGHVPDVIAADLGHGCSPLMNDTDMELAAELEFTGTEHVLIRNVLRRSFQLALSGVIDFNDQLLLPAVTRCTFQPFNTVLVDEAQDLSELNHVLIGKIVAGRRLIAVGDQNQAIYAFRGAHEDGMAKLQDRFGMRTLSLSCSFRCPDEVVRSVLWRTPNMTSWADNPNNPGSVTHMGLWSLSDLPEHCAVICRNNAPLFGLAIKLLRAGRNAKLWGRDLATGLIKDLEGLGSQLMSQEESLESLASWHQEKLAKAKKAAARNRIEDRMLCLKMFIEAAKNLGEAIAYAKSVFSQEGTINLMTGHKSKGGEWNDVFFLDQLLLSDEGQDLNLRYVIHTRAKRNLTFIDSAMFVGDE